MHDSVEEWKPVLGYEGFYEVSNLGAVRRVKPYRGRALRPFLTPVLDCYGYYGISLSKNSRVIRVKIHKLVAAAFIGVRPEGYDINHKDANKRNNCVWNLEYVTRKENIHHAIKNGNRGRGFSKLNKRKVGEIKELVNRMSSEEIGKLYGVSKYAICDIKYGRTWLQADRMQKRLHPSKN